MPEHVLAIVHSVMVFAGLVVAGGAIYSGLVKIAQALGDKDSSSG